MKRSRYEQWLRDPRAQLPGAPLFDLRPVHGRDSLWHDVEAAVAGAVDRDLLRVLANDCLASMPPLTFFQDAVVDESGDHTAIFVWSIARCGRSWTSDASSGWQRAGLRHLDEERFAGARARCCPSTRRFSATCPRPASSSVAAGAHRDQPGHQRPDLPPALLSRHDRHVLKSGSFDPAAARAHRQLLLGRRVVTEPSLVDRYRRSFDVTWTDETPIDQVRFVVLDSETTGLNPQTDRIITIGAVAVSAHEIVLEDSFDALLTVAKNTSAP